MAHLIPNIIQKFFDANGEPLVGGKLYSFQAGTSTPLATYQDAAETTPNTNPIILDANGECRVFIGAQAYKFRLDDANDVTLWTEDGISHISNGSVTTDKIANGAVTAPKLADSSVLESKIGTGAVTESKIGTGAVTESKLGALSVSTAKIQDGAVTNAKIADGTIETAKLTNSALSVLIQAKNKIMNGDFEIRQRASYQSYAPINSGMFFADRWRYIGLGSMSLNVSKSSNVPTFAQAGRVISSSALFQVATADTSIGIAEYANFYQVIEGFYFQGIAQKPITISFWVRSSVVGKYCVTFSNDPHDLSYVTEYEILAANTWEFKNITCSGTPSGGTWHYGAAGGLRVEFSLAAGSDSQGSVNTWNSGAKFSTSNQVNFCGTNGNQFYITGVQLESGGVATQFDIRPYDVELNMVKRYCEILDFSFRGYNPSVAATAAIGGIAPFAVEKPAPTPPTFISGPSVTGSLTGAGVVSSSSKGIELAANFTAGGAGPVRLYGSMSAAYEYL